MLLIFDLLVEDAYVEILRSDDSKGSNFTIYSQLD